ncbi:MAG: hypothetical protein IV108_10445 [Burkholderiales bacterium]|nr:hypothetical protein [Burkholderiales bacterium]
MSTKILVSLSARKACFALFDRNGLTGFTAYDNDDRALHAFGDLLARHRDVPVYLMVDTVEEEYRTELMPHVWGGARREMSKRKLAQLFRTVPYRAAWLQGRDTGAGKRRDDVYLFLALNSGDLLRPYLDLIHSRRAPLAGIYLLPQVTQALASRLKCATAGVLLVSRQQGGLRQSFFLQGRLRISRLTPLDPLGEPATAESYAAEVEKSRLFLYNSRLLPRETRLTVLILDADEGLAQVSNLLSQDATFHCQRIGFEQLRAALASAPNDLPRDPEALHLFLLGKYPPQASLAEPRLTGDFTSHRLRAGLYAASAVIAVAALMWSGYNLYRGYANQRATQDAIADTTRYRNQYAEAAKQFPATPVAAEHLRQAVEFTDQIKKFQRTPEPFMQLLSQVLSEFPQIELNRLDWRYASTTATPQSSAGDVSPSAWQQQGEIEAEIRPFTGDYRAALLLIERFAASLRAQPNVAGVTIVKLPLNLDPASTLSGSTQDSTDAKPGAAQFKLGIVIRRES